MLPLWPHTSPASLSGSIGDASPESMSLMIFSAALDAFARSGADAVIRPICSAESVTARKVLRSWLKVRKPSRMKRAPTRKAIPYVHCNTALSKLWPKATEKMAQASLERSERSASRYIVVERGCKPKAATVREAEMLSERTVEASSSFLLPSFSMPA